MGDMRGTGMPKSRETELERVEARIHVGTQARRHAGTQALMETRTSMVACTGSKAHTEIGREAARNSDSTSTITTRIKRHGERNR